MKQRKQGKKSRISKKKAYLAALGAIIVLIMVGGAINFDNDSEDSYEYKGIKFINVNNGWQAHLESGRKVFILNNPAELENMTIGNVPLSGLNMLNKLYISYDPQDRVRAAIGQFYSEINPQPLKVPACTVDVPQCADMPLKTCNDTSETVGVVVFREANETKVEFEDNCLTIQGEYLDKIVDKLILEQL